MHGFLRFSLRLTAPAIHITPHLYCTIAESEGVSRAEIRASVGKEQKKGRLPKADDPTENYPKGLQPESSFHLIRVI
jgi:hypothetical protein